MTGNTGDEYVVTEPKAFGPVIRKIRDSQDVRQLQLSERTGINRSRVSNLENGDNNEVVRDLMRIFNELGYEVAIRPKTS